ncbi:MAG: RecX family transcriptional regulator [bacterium]|nr:RecX family transcriptional regulator [bacterium]
MTAAPCHITSPSYSLDFVINSPLALKSSNFTSDDALFDFLDRKIFELLPQFARFLSARPHSHREIIKYLSTKLGQKYRFLASPDSFWPDWLNHLTQAGLIESDAKFVEFWLASRSNKTPRSLYGIKYELTQKGIDPKLIDQVINKMQAEGRYDELDALKLLYKRYKNKPLLKFKQAAYRHGFQKTTLERLLKTTSS